jgi:hypothetical protein
MSEQSAPAAPERQQLAPQAAKERGQTRQAVIVPDVELGQTNSALAVVIGATPLVTIATKAAANVAVTAIKERGQTRRAEIAADVERERIRNAAPPRTDD